MAFKRRHLYIKSLIIALLTTILLHFSSILVMAGFDFFGSAGNPLRASYIPGARNLLTSNAAVFLFLATELCVIFNIQYGRKRFRFGRIAVAVCGVSLTYGIISYFIYGGTSAADTVHMRMFGTLVAGLTLSVMVVIITYIDHLNRKQERIALENESLKTQNIKSRYDALKNQIDPHFLFNTFSSLTSMIEMDPARAQEFSLKMSSVFRYTLQNKDYVTLAEELEFTRDYCALMQIRYGENLTVCFDVEEKYNSYLVVPLCVQTLLENAVKHNEISNRSPMKISVHTNSSATLTVSNGINAKREEARGTGTGLANLSERYLLKWKREIQIYSNEKIFMVTIPLIAAEK